MAKEVDELTVKINAVFDAEECPRIEVLNLQPGDTLVLRTKQMISAATHAKLVDLMTQTFPGAKVAVVGDDMELHVVRQEPE